MAKQFFYGLICSQLGVSRYRSIYLRLQIHFDDVSVLVVIGHMIHTRNEVSKWHLQQTVRRTTNSW